MSDLVNKAHWGETRRPGRLAGLMAVCLVAAQLLFAFHTHALDAPDSVPVDDIECAVCLLAGMPVGENDPGGIPERPESQSVLTAAADATSLPVTDTGSHQPRAPPVSAS